MKFLRIQRLLIITLFLCAVQTAATATSVRNHWATKYGLVLGAGATALALESAVQACSTKVTVKERLQEFKLLYGKNCSLLFTNPRELARQSHFAAGIAFAMACGLGYCVTCDVRTCLTPKAPQDPQSPTAAQAQADLLGDFHPLGYVGRHMLIDASHKPMNRLNPLVLQGGCSTVRGERPYQEDRCLEYLSGDCAVYGVCDGHGGQRAAQYAADNLPAKIEASLAIGTDVVAAIVSAFKTTDDEFCALALQERLDDGSTVSALIIQNGKVYTANAGDSRIVIGKVDGTLIATDDHKPNDPGEKARIEAVGGLVLFHGCWRVQGILAVSRSLGDRPLKAFVPATPDVTEHSLTGPDRAVYAVCASDGLWDVMRSAEVDTFVRAALQTKQKPHKIAQLLVREALCKGSRDNITAQVLVFA